MESVLYLTYDGLSDPLGQSQILPYLKGLSKVGYSITIISFEKKEPYSILQKEISTICKESNISWHPLSFHLFPPIISKLYDRFLMKRKAKMLHKIEKFSIIHCRSYVSSEVGLYFKKKLGVAFLFDMRGFWADERIDNGQWNVKKWWYKKIYKHYKNLEKEFVIESNHIISLTEKGMEELGNLYKKELLDSNQNIQLKCTIIPTCADFEVFDYNKIIESQQLELREKLNIGPTQIVLCYSGSLGGWYMINEMLLFFKAFKEIYPFSIFLFLTKDKNVLLKAISENLINEEDVVIHFSQKKELPLYLSLSNYAVFFIKPFYSKLASSPTKHAEIMGLGIPVFCNDIGDTGKLMRTHKIGALLEADKPAEFEKIVKEESLHQYDKGEIKAVGLKYFDVEEGIKKYTSVYEKILQSTIKNS